MKTQRKASWFASTLLAAGFSLALACSANAQTADATSASGPQTTGMPATEQQGDCAAAGAQPVAAFAAVHRPRFELCRRCPRADHERERHVRAGYAFAWAAHARATGAGPLHDHSDVWQHDENAARECRRQRQRARDVLVPGSSLSVTRLPSLPSWLTSVRLS